MADKPAATLLHTGPGLANGLANLHNARRAGTPIVNVVGDHASYHLPYDAPLTSDIEALAGAMSAWVHRISGPDDVAPAAAAAHRAAVSLPGIATLILPADAAWGEPHRPIPTVPASPVPPPPQVGAERIRLVADALRGSGGRCGLVLAGLAARSAPLEMADRIAGGNGRPAVRQHVRRARRAWTRSGAARAHPLSGRRSGGGLARHRCPCARVGPPTRGVLRISEQAERADPARRAGADPFAARRGCDGRPRSLGGGAEAGRTVLASADRAAGAGGFYHRTTDRRDPVDRGGAAVARQCHRDRRGADLGPAGLRPYPERAPPRLSDGLPRRRDRGRAAGCDGRRSGLSRPQGAGPPG